MLTDVINQYRTGTYKVFRRGEGEYVYGRLVRSPAIDADVELIDDGADTIKITGHGLSNDSGPLYLSTDDTMPVGPEELAPYWAQVIDDDTFQLKTGPGPSPVVDFEDGGVGTLHVANYFLADLSIQPAGGGLKDEPGGQHTEATFTVWSTVELKSREPGYEADLVEMNGELHRVDSVDYFGILSNHWKATIVREKTP